MKTPPVLQTLIDEGIVGEVLGALKSGKEASVHLITSGGQLRCAKVYKDARQRSFQTRSDYTEGRRHRGSREQRAMQKGSRYGRDKEESAWKNVEVEALFRLHGAGVRVPRPYGVYDGVLIMELVTDAEGYPAPRLNDVNFEPEQAREWHRILLNQVVRMLCAGMIHGDLSAYNILASAHGPVIIDLPQAIDAAGNNNAFRMLERDVNNLRTSFGAYAPELLKTDYAHEIWKLFEERTLRPDTELTGHFVHDTTPVDLDSLLYEVEEAQREHEAREAGRVEAAAERADLERKE